MVEIIGQREVFVVGVLGAMLGFPFSAYAAHAVGQIACACGVGLGVKVAVTFLMAGTITGMLMAIFFDNSGGAQERWSRGVESVGRAQIA